MTKAKLKTILSNRQAPIKDKVKIDDGTGFVRVNGTIIKSGIMQYSASELGLDGSKDELINVYLPQDELKNQDFLNNLNGVSVTNGHPDEFISPSTKPDIIIGNAIGSILLSGEDVTASFQIREPKTALEIMNKDHKELSLGYYSDIEPETGYYNGQEYSFVQKNLIPNHVAIVPKGRAGASVKIHNEKEKEKMETEKITINGNDFEVPKDAAAAYKSEMEKMKLQNSLNLDAATNKRLMEVQEQKIKDLTAELDAVKAEQEKSKIENSANDDVKQSLRFLNYAVQLDEDIDVNKSLESQTPSQILNASINKFATENQIAVVIPDDMDASAVEVIANSMISANEKLKELGHKSKVENKKIENGAGGKSKNKSDEDYRFNAIFKGKDVK